MDAPLQRFPTQSVPVIRQNWNMSDQCKIGARGPEAWVPRCLEIPWVV
jgi:hypothetical protein